MKRLSRVLTFVAGASLVLGCGSKSPDSDESESSSEASDAEASGSGDASSGAEGSGSSDTTASGSTGSDTTATSTTTDTSASESDGTGGFVDVDMAVGGSMCDIWNPDDCGEGEKCMPYASEMGTTWDALKCVEVDANPQLLGDECFASDGPYGGVDDCDAGLYCYYINEETNQGTCIEFCTGSPTSPMCGPDAICTIVNDGVLVLCRPECDPIAQDCEPAGSGCYQATGTGSFTCIIDKSGPSGAYNDVCDLISTCDPGNACVDAAAMPSCSGAACCTNFCDVTEPNNCPDADQGQTCEPYYDQPDPGYENVGICVLPTPKVSEPVLAAERGAPE